MTQDKEELEQGEGEIVDIIEDIIEDIIDEELIEDIIDVDDQED